MDHLDLIRESVVNKQKVASDGDFYVFSSGIRVARKAPTSFIHSLKKTSYTAEDLFFFLETYGKSTSEIRKEAFKLGVTPVNTLDQKEVYDYLNGTIQTSSKIVRSAATAPDAGTSGADGSAGAPTADATSSSGGTGSGGAPVRIERTVEEVEVDRLFKALAGLRKQEQEGQDVTTDILGVDRQILTILRNNEKPVFTRSTIMSRQGSDFKFAIKMYGNQILEGGASEKKDDGRKRKGSAAHDSGPFDPSKRRKGQVLSTDRKSYVTGPAIIIVPNAPTATINSLNSLPFLEGKYISVEECRTAGIKRKPDLKLTRRNRDGSQIEFVIKDNVNNMDTGDWERVVAVFATGQAWQFKGWKFNTPGDVFSNILGVHVTFDDRAVNPNCAAWDCKVLKINQHKRHLDGVASNDFWVHLNKFILLRKPYLLPGFYQQN